MMLASDEMEMFRLNEEDLFEAIEDGYFEFEYKADRRYDRLRKQGIVKSRKLSALEEYLP